MSHSVLNGAVWPVDVTLPGWIWTWCLVASKLLFGRRPCRLFPRWHSGIYAEGWR